MSYTISNNIAKTKAVFGQNPPVDTGEVATFGEYETGYNNSKVIYNYADLMNRLIVEQFEESDNLHAVVASFAQQIQEIEKELSLFMTKQSLNYARGDQLDGIGEIVGEPRKGRNDTDYNEAIDFKITLNKSGGEINTIVEYVQKVTEASYVQLIEHFPATIQIALNTNKHTKKLRENLEKLTAAGVTVLDPIINTGKTLFSMAGDDSKYAKGFGEGGLGKILTE